MILKFNPSLFTNGDVKIQSILSKIILEILNERFLWDIDNLDEIFLNDENNFETGEFSSKFLSKVDRQALLDKIENLYEVSTYISKEQIFYLNTLIVGLEEGEVHPDDIYKILTIPSLILLENSVGDSYFIRGLINIYTKQKKRKSIYNMLKIAYDNMWLEPSNAGGGGGIKNELIRFEEGKYFKILHYKIATIFDSDRDNEIGWNFKYKNLIKYLKYQEDIDLSVLFPHYDYTDRIIWHMLYKREMENYLPKNVILDFNMLAIKEKQELDSKTITEMDFIDYEKFFSNNSEVEVKKDFPPLFMNVFDYQQIESQCSHHKILIDAPNDNLEEVFESEAILLKLAKII